MNDMSATAEVFDKTDFLRRMMNDEELAAEIMSEYLIDMSEQLVRLRKASTTEDLPTLVRLAHTIKGASANVGADAMRQTAFLAEKAAAREDRDEFLRLVPEIETRFASLRKLLADTGFIKS